MENKYDNSFTITLSKEDKLLFDFFADQACFDIDEDDEKKEAILKEKYCKDALERAVKFYQTYVSCQDGGTHSSIAPNALQEVIKNKSKEELLNIREMFANELVRLAKLFDKNAAFCGAVPDYEKPEKYWDVNIDSVVGHIVMYANYLSMIDELITGKKPDKNKDPRHLANSEVRVDEKGSIKLF